MTPKDLVLVKHRDTIRAAAARHKCRSIALAGSVARAEDTDDSDYDFVADFDKGRNDLRHVWAAGSAGGSAWSGSRRRAALKRARQLSLHLRRRH